MNNDLISRKALKREFGYTDEWYKGRTVCAIIDNAPTVEERPKGRWVISKDGTYPICSVCITRGSTQYNGVEPIPKCTNYCSNCGADMRSEQNLSYADNDTAQGGLASAT